MMRGTYDAIESNKQNERDADRKKMLYESIKNLKHVCPECNSWEGVKFPRCGKTYCEDCGWTDGQEKSKK